MSARTCRQEWQARAAAQRAAASACHRRVDTACASGRQTSQMVLAPQLSSMRWRGCAYLGCGGCCESHEGHVRQRLAQLVQVAVLQEGQGGQRLQERRASGDAGGRLCRPSSPSIGRRPQASQQLLRFTACPAPSMPAIHPTSVLKSKPHSEMQCASSTATSARPCRDGRGVPAQVRARACAACCFWEDGTCPQVAGWLGLSATRQPGNRRGRGSPPSPAAHAGGRWRWPPARG